MCQVRVICKFIAYRVAVAGTQFLVHASGALTGFICPTHLSLGHKHSTMAAFVRGIRGFFAAVLSPGKKEALREAEFEAALGEAGWRPQTVKRRLQLDGQAGEAPAGEVVMVD